MHRPARAVPLLEVASPCPDSPKVYCAGEDGEGRRVAESQHGPSRAPVCPNRSQAATRDFTGGSPCGNRAPPMSTLRGLWTRPLRSLPLRGPRDPEGPHGQSHPNSGPHDGASRVAPMAPPPGHRAGGGQARQVGLSSTGLTSSQPELPPVHQLQTASLATLRTPDVQHDDHLPKGRDGDGSRVCGGEGLPSPFGSPSIPPGGSRSRGGEAPSEGPRQRP